MLKNYDISFEKGSILTGRMLSLMYNVPRKMAELVYSEQTDGIIAGMNFSVNEDKLIVSPGLYKKDNRIYILEETMSFEVHPEDETKYCLILTSDTEKINSNIGTGEHNISEKVIDIKLREGDYSFSPEDIKLCEFWTVPRLPVSYNDLLSSGSFLNITSCIYSALNEPTYVPYVFSLVLNKFKEKKNKHPLDYVIMNSIMSDGVVSKSILREYISEAKLNSDLEDDYEFLKTFILSIDKLEFKCSVVSISEDIQEDLERNDDRLLVLN